MSGQLNRVKSRDNQKLHLLTSHASSLLLRQPDQTKEEFEDELYVRVHELISFCNVLWASHMQPVHIGILHKKSFSDQGVQCRSPDDLQKELEAVMCTSQFVPFIFDRHVNFICEANLKKAFDMIPASSASVEVVGTPFSNKVARVSGSPEYIAAGDRGRREAQVYLLHAHRCLGHGVIRCRKCVSASCVCVTSMPDGGRT